MRKLLLIPVLSLLLFSCSKNTLKDDTVPQVPAGKHAVSFSIADFIQNMRALDAVVHRQKKEGLSDYLTFTT